MAGNTNYYQVLDLAGVQQLWDTCKATFVRTVNGNGIDANGNVQINVAGDFQVNGSSILVNGVANINTQSAYNASTNKIATILDAHPVGSYHISDDPTSPASLFGGTWTQVIGKFLLASDDVLTNGVITTAGSYHVGDTGGSVTHAHDAGNNWTNLAALFTMNDGSGKLHLDAQNMSVPNAWTTNRKYTIDSNWSAPGTGNSDGLATKVVGVTADANHLPPYTTTYIWKRVS